MILSLIGVVVNVEFYGCVGDKNVRNYGSVYCNVRDGCFRTISVVKQMDLKDY